MPRRITRRYVTVRIKCVYFIRAWENIVFYSRRRCCIRFRGNRCRIVEKPNVGVVISNLTVCAAEQTTRVRRISLSLYCRIRKFYFRDGAFAYFNIHTVFYNGTSTHTTQNSRFYPQPPPPQKKYACEFFFLIDAYLVWNLEMLKLEVTLALALATSQSLITSRQNTILFIKS